MATTVHCKVDSTEFSREQFKERLGWWTDRALDSENPTRWVESFDGGTELRRRYRWDLYAEVGDEIVDIATIAGPLPRLAFRRTRLTIVSAIPEFESVMAEALGTRRRDALKIMMRRCTVDGTAERSSEWFEPRATPAPSRVLHPA